MACPVNSISTKSLSKDFGNTFETNGLESKAFRL